MSLNKAKLEAGVEGCKSCSLPVLSVETAARGQDHGVGRETGACGTCVGKSKKTHSKALGAFWSPLPSLNHPSLCQDAGTLESLDASPSRPPSRVTYSTVTLHTLSYIEYRKCYRKIQEVLISMHLIKRQSFTFSIC